MFTRTKWMKRGGRLGPLWNTVWKKNDDNVDDDGDADADLNSVSLINLCDDLLEVVKSESKNPQHRISLRTSAHLLYGIIVLYKKKLTSICDSFQLLPPSPVNLSNIETSMSTDESDEEFDTSCTPPRQLLHRDDNNFTDDEIEAVRQAEISTNEGFEFSHYTNVPSAEKSCSQSRNINQKSPQTEYTNENVSFDSNVQHSFHNLDDGAFDLENISILTERNEGLENISNAETVENEIEFSSNKTHDNSLNSLSECRPNSRKRKYSLQSGSHISNYSKKNRVGNVQTSHFENSIKDKTCESNIDWNDDNIICSSPVDKMNFNDHNVPWHSISQFHDSMYFYFPKDKPINNIQTVFLSKNIISNNVNATFEKIGENMRELFILKLLNDFWIRKEEISLRVFLKLFTEKYRSVVLLLIMRLIKYEYIKGSGSYFGYLFAGPAFITLKLLDSNQSS